MQPLTLTPRLQLAASFVPDGAVVIDVGTDHAYLPIYLLESGKCSRAVAADINALPLKRAEDNIRAHGLSDKIRLLLCDGLSKMDAAVGDTIVIAGMGGETIADILAHAPWTKEKTLILQPMTNAARLRKFLRLSGYRITDEAPVAEDRRLYTVMQVTGGVMEQDEVYDHISMALLARGREESTRPLVLRYLDRIIDAQKKAQAGRMVSGSDTAAQDELLAALTTLHTELEGTTI